MSAHNGAARFVRGLLSRWKERDKLWVMTCENCNGKYKVSEIT